MAPPLSGARAPALLILSGRKRNSDELSFVHYLGAAESL
jgi:hypothetical protein